jgi:hypothetical protein
MAVQKKETVTSEKIKLWGRGAFLKIDKPKPYEEGATPRWESTVLLDPASLKGKESIKLLIKTAAAVAKQAYGVVPLSLRKLSHQFAGGPQPGNDIKDDEIKLAFYDGSKKEYDGFAGMLAVPAHEYEDRPKPAVANRKGVTVSPGEEQYPYSGAQIIQSVTLWCQDNKNGKRIGINLRGVQFVADGEPFAGGGEINAEDEFDALEDEAPSASGDDLGMD